MACASGLFNPTASGAGGRFFPFVGVYGSGSWFSPGVSKGIFCASTAHGAEKLHASESKSPRLGTGGCKLIGCGSAVPSLQISNDDLSKIVDTNDEWIAVRTGIRNRRILSGKDSLIGLAVDASKKALEMAAVNPNDVDLVLLCTSTPEDLFGSAPQIPRALGCKNNPLAFDITAACSGFILGLFSASCYIRGGGLKNVLVIGADALSRHVDWTDRGTCILFGDGAGAVLLQACDSKDNGIFSFDLHSDGDGQRHLNALSKVQERVDEPGTNGSLLSALPKGSSYSFIGMNGKEVFRFALSVVPQSIEVALGKAGLTNSNIDWLLLHQANQRIIDGVASRLELPSQRVISNLENYGNTSAASIPLALDEAVRSGKVREGHTIAAAGLAPASPGARPFSDGADDSSKTPRKISHISFLFPLKIMRVSCNLVSFVNPSQLIIVRSEFPGNYNLPEGVQETCFFDKCGFCGHCSSSDTSVCIGSALASPAMLKCMLKIIYLCSNDYLLIVIYM